MNYLLVVQVFVRIPFGSEIDGTQHHVATQLRSPTQSQLGARYSSWRLTHAAGMGQWLRHCCAYGQRSSNFARQKCTLSGAHATSDN